VAGKRLDILLDKDLYDWLEAQIKSGVFYSRRHGIEFALSRLRKAWEKSEAKHDPKGT